jgi:hypothetical protein
MSLLVKELPENGEWLSECSTQSSTYKTNAHPNSRSSLSLLMGSFTQHTPQLKWYPLFPKKTKKSPQFLSKHYQFAVDKLYEAVVAKIFDSHLNYRQELNCPITMKGLILKPRSRFFSLASFVPG